MVKLIMINCRFFYFCIFVLLLVCQALPVKAVMDGIPEFWDERRSMPVPDIEYLCTYELSEKEKAAMLKAVELLLYTEMEQEYLWAPKVGVYKDLMERMPEELPYRFAQALTIVVEGLHYDDLHAYPQGFDHMSPLHEMASRSWLILEAYCRKYLDFSLELESVKMMGRLRNYVWKGRPDREKLEPALLEQIEKTRTTNREQYYQLHRKIFAEKSKNIPGIGFKGCADDNTRQIIQNWYEKAFMSLVPSAEKTILFRRSHEGNRLDTNITGLELSEAKISFDGLPEELQQLLRHELEVAADGDRKYDHTEKMLYVAYKRNLYLIELIGMSLDEYCGFMWDTLQSMTNDPPKNGHSWSVHYGYRTKEEQESRNQQIDKILQQWREQGVPEFKYLGQKELLFFNE